MKQGPDLVTKRVKANLSTMPLGVKLAFILVATLLLPGVTPKSVRRSDETTVTPSASVADGPKADNLEKEAALEKHELESNEMATDSSEVDDSLNHDATESTLLAEEEAGKEEETNEEKEKDSYDDYDNTGRVDNTAEGEIPGDLAGDGIAEDEIAEVMSLIVKRAAEEGDKVGDPQADSIDVDNFQFSDFPKIIEPLVRAFSSSPEDSNAPSEDDFFFWFPAMKKFLEFAMKESDAARPVTKPARRSGLTTPSEPSRQIAPASTQPAESDVLPPTLGDVFITPELPTIAGPFSPVQPLLSDVSDSEEEVY